MTKPKNNQALGVSGEAFGANFLEKKGHTLLARNWRGKYGELDLVSLDGNTLVFTEVKTRRGRAFGPPQNAVTPAKQQRLSRAALEFMASGAYDGHNARFDVLALMRTPEGFSVEWLCDAFGFDPGELF